MGTLEQAELHELAQHLRARLGEPDLELPSIRFQGVALDPAGVAEEMTPLVDDLGQALDAVTREERRTEAMTIARDEALDAYTRTFLWVAQSAEALFKLADLPAVAKRVRPSSRRPGVTNEVEKQGPDIPSDDPEEPTGEVTDEVPGGEASNDEVPDVSTQARPDIPPVE